MKTKMFVRSALMACGIALAGLVVNASAFATGKLDLRLPTEVATDVPGDGQTPAAQREIVFKTVLRAGTVNVFDVISDSDEDLVYVIRSDGRIDRMWSAKRDEFTKYNYSEDPSEPALIGNISGKLSDQSPDQLGIRFSGPVSMRELLSIEQDDRDIPKWLATSTEQVEEQLPGADSLTDPVADSNSAGAGGKQRGEAGVKACIPNSTGYFRCLAQSNQCSSSRATGSMACSDYQGHRVCRFYFRPSPLCWLFCTSPHGCR
ncbi:MAG: hypothetical protein ABL931_15175 [Usitatibacteraceae bacterium]